MRYSQRGETRPAITAPRSAPSVVTTSSAMPSLRLVSRSRMYADAEALLVAITATMLAPMANRIGMPSRSVNTGTMMMPPPNPRIAPPIPAPTETRKIAKNTRLSRARRRYGEADSIRARALLWRAGRDAADAGEEARMMTHARRVAGRATPGAGVDEVWDPG